MRNPDLPKAELERLAQEGYHDLEQLGEGHTRTSYEARFKKGDINTKRVVKIPKKEINKDSICTLINLSKGDPIKN